MTKKPIVICVDDEEIVLRSLKSQLRNFLGREYIIETAIGGDDALELLADLLAENREICLVISDYIMPGMKGDELLKRIHQILPQTIKIMLTGQADLEAVGKAIEYAKLYRYIAKPWQSEDFQLTVQEALRSYFQDKQIKEQNAKLQQLNEELENLIEQRTVALRLSEEKFAKAFRSTPHAISIISCRDERHVEVNDAFCKMIGYGAEEIIGLTGSDLNLWVSLQDREDFFKTIEDIGFIRNLEIAFRTKSGIVKTALLSAEAININEENCIISVSQDISDRKLAEAKLRESQQRLSFLFEQTPIAIIEWNTNLEIIAWNPAAQATFGYNKQEALGQNIIDFLVPENIKDNINTIVDELLNLRGGTYSLNKNITKDNKTIICEWYNTALIDRVGKVIGGAGIAVDITERKQAETELRESAEREKAIATAIERIRQTLNIETIFNSTTSELRQVINCDRVAIYQFNLDWSGEFVAESVADGWIPLVSDNVEFTDVVDNHECTVKKFGGDDLVLDTYLQETQGGVYNQGVHYLCVEDIYTAGFQPCYINLLEKFQAKAYITVPIFCGSKLWGLLATYQNSGSRQWKQTEINVVIQISTQLGVALQQAELLEQTQRQSLELMKAKESADAANQAKSQFIAKMSHELRTPLNAILGFSQIMSRSDNLSKEQLEYLQIINRSGEHLLQLINDILSMAKIESGQVNLNEHTFNLYELLNSLEEMLALKANSKGLQIKFNCSSELPEYIQTDESKLRQVLINLLGNAIKFTKQGNVDLKVSKLVSNTKQLEDPIDRQQIRIEFVVEDTGPGIAPNEIPTLFEPFVQTETGRQSMQGTGLGLPISYQFIKLMGGEIAVKSQLYKGTTFTFNILVKVVDSIIQNKTAIYKKAIGLEPNQPNYRILIVEDVAENRQLLVEILSPLGLELKEAQNGQEAISIWHSWQPHLIWMDIQMPIVNGYEATREIKSHPKGKDTIIIALTAIAFEEDRSAIFQAGCDDFMVKPFREEILLEKMSTHLGLRYLYADALPHPSFNSLTPVKCVTSSDLSIMPEEWLLQMYRAALAVDDYQVIDLIEEIPESETDLINGLKDLVDNFRMDIIIELTKPYVKE